MEKRWIQRFDNFSKALKHLSEAVEIYNSRSLSNLEKQGVVQGFEFTHELAWKVMKDFFNDRGNNNIYGSKDATREAFQFDLISDGDVWMSMIQSRNLSSHTYDEDTIENIIDIIFNSYYERFVEFEKKMKDLLVIDND